MAIPHDLTHMWNIEKQAHKSWEWWFPEAMEEGEASVGEKEEKDY